MTVSKAKAMASRLQQQIQVSVLGASSVMSFDSSGFPILAITKGSETLWVSLTDKGNAGRVNGVGLPQKSYSPHAAQLLRQNWVGQSQVVDITAVGGTLLDGKFFLLADENGTVGFWFDLTGSTSMPVTGAARNVKVSTVLVGDSASQVAGKLITAIGADSKFTAALVSGAHLQATNKFVGIISAVPGAGTSGFTVAVFQAGINLPSQLELREKAFGECVKLGLETQLWEGNGLSSFDLTGASLVATIFPSPIFTLTDGQ